MSSTFRFHSPLDDRITQVVKLLRRRRSHPKFDLLPIAADKTSITDESGTRSINTYEDCTYESYMTLTRQESDLIAVANPGTKPPLVLEDLHPWLPTQRFHVKSTANWKTLNMVLHRFGDHFVIPSEFCDKKWNKICNAVRRKTDYDTRYYLAWHLPIQDSFVLEETRSDRRVIAIDFYSMYASCMQYDFPKPSTVYHVQFGRDAIKGEYLRCGLYRCMLHPNASDFLKKYNPFRTFFAGRYLGASIEEPLTVDLNEFEIEFFQKHFERVYLIDAVVSDDRISHPLARDARRHHARRKHFISNNNKALADREKFLMTLLSSCSQRSLNKCKSFSAYSSVFKHLKRMYGIDLNDCTLGDRLTQWLNGQKKISLQENQNEIIYSGPDIYDGFGCFQFTQRIVARSRIILLETMERLIQTNPDIEICYANIDSLHFSLPTWDLEEVLGRLQKETSDQFGSFRIESVSERGLWLEPGRYWLYSQKVDRFRNCGATLLVNMRDIEPRKEDDGFDGAFLSP